MTAPREPSLDTLLAWWCGELSADEARAVEERIFTDDAWADAAETLADMATLVRDATRAGFMAGTALTGSALRRLEAEGVPIRHYVVDPGGICPCQASRDRYTMLHLRADVGEARRVDLHLETSEGLSVWVEDLAVDRDGGQVVLAWPGEEIRAQPDQTIRFTLYATEGEGRRVVGSYTLQHSSRLAD